MIITTNETCKNLKELFKPMCSLCYLRSLIFVGKCCMIIINFSGIYRNFRASGD